MAVRHLDIIEKVGSKYNTICNKKIERGNAGFSDDELTFLHWFDLINMCKQDAIDYNDTYESLLDNNLWDVYINNWYNKENVIYTMRNTNERITIFQTCRFDKIAENYFRVLYNPNDNTIDLRVAGSMTRDYNNLYDKTFKISTISESYKPNFLESDDFSWYKDMCEKFYFKECLDTLANNLQDYLTNFFKWVENLK